LIDGIGCKSDWASSLIDGIQTTNGYKRTLLAFHLTRITFVPAVRVAARKMRCDSARQFQNSYRSDSLDDGQIYSNTSANPFNLDFEVGG